jgi:hypothetical protein
VKEDGDQSIMAARIRRPLGLTIVAALALLQGVLGLLRSFEIVRFGVNLTEQGALLLPLLGILTAARGGLVAIIALLYLLFAVGALRQDAWSWWVGLAAALLNGLLVVNAMAQGASIALSLLWAVVPLVLVSYLFAPAGRRALRGQTRP